MTEFSDESRRAFLKVAAVSGAALLPQGALQTAAAQSGQSASGAGGSSQGGTAADRVRALLEGPEVIQGPVFHDMVSLKLIQHLGFPIAFVGGSPVASNVYGMGDYGTLTMTELIDFAARSVELSDLPIISDADDGGGSPLSVHRTIKRFEHVGVAGVMIEDMHGAKHLPGLPEGPMQSIPQFVDKIKAAVDARKGRMLLIARCDGMSAGEPFAKGLERLAAYAEAGADVVFMAGGGIKRSPEIAKATNRPVLTTVPPDHPDAALNVLRESQVKMAVYAGHLMGVAARAVHDALVELKQTGRVANYQQRALPRDVMGKILDSEEAVDIAKRFNAGNWP